MLLEITKRVEIRASFQKKFSELLILYRENFDSIERQKLWVANLELCNFDTSEW